MEKSQLEVPVIWSHNRSMKTIKRELYESLVNELLDTPDGLDIYCWLRRRTDAHYEHTFDGVLEGSSDVSCYMYELWLQYGEDSLGENFGWWINGEICDIIGVPRVTATEQYHDKERA